MYVPFKVVCSPKNGRKRFPGIVCIEVTPHPECVRAKDCSDAKILITGGMSSDKNTSAWRRSQKLADALNALVRRHWDGKDLENENRERLLISAIEFGYKQCEAGNNLQLAIANFVLAGRTKEEK